MVNCGKGSHPIAPAERLYISFTSAGTWLRAHYPDSKSAMPVQLLKPGTPAPPHPPPPPPAPSRSCGGRFDFRRLGQRVAAMLISPWVPAGSVFQRPKGPYNTSQFELSSMPATIKNLFNLSGFLTKRDAWAGSLTELFTLDKPRTDAPMHFPDAPPGHEELERRRRLHAEAAGGDAGEAGGGGPRHCSAKQKPAVACDSDGGVTQRQRNNIAKFSALTGLAPPPELEAGTLSYEAAAVWIHSRYSEFVRGD